MAEIKKISFVTTVNSFNNISTVEEANECTLYAIVEYDDNSVVSCSKYQDALPYLKEIKKNNNLDALEILNYRKYRLFEDKALGEKIERVKKEYLKNELKEQEVEKEKEETKIEPPKKETSSNKQESPLKLKLIKKAMSLGIVMIASPFLLSGAQHNVTEAVTADVKTIETKEVEEKDPIIINNLFLQTRYIQRMIEQAQVVALDVDTPVETDLRTASLQENDDTYQKFYATGNHFYESGIKGSYNPNQCTTYALGRVKEVRSKYDLNNNWVKSFDNYGHAGYWLENHKRAYKEGETDLAWSDDLDNILPGCVLVWTQDITSKPNDPKAGHVAYVESVEYYEDGTVSKVNYTEGNWNGNESNIQGLQYRSATKDEIYYRNNSVGMYYRQLKYQGFIYTLQNPTNVDENGKVISIDKENQMNSVIEGQGKRV